MKLKNLLLLSGAGLLAWRLLKKNSKKNYEPGALNKFMSRVSNSLDEPVDYIPADISKSAWRD